MINSKVKTILITGSGSGFGRDSALALAMRGHRVIASTHSQVDADALNKLAKDEELSLEAIVLDVTKAEDRAKILEYHIDVLINNAGIGETGSLAEIDIDKVRHNFEVNLFGPLELSQLALRSMIPRQSGTIIFISSLLGRVTSPFFGPYSMTKFAVSSGAEMLRKELALLTDGINVTVIEPGAYRTGFNQKMMATKFKWMKPSSYFANVIDAVKRSQERQFKLVEQMETSTLIAKIIYAAEAEKPPFRLVAPWWQGLGVRVLRALGR